MKKITLAAALALGFLIIPNQAHAASYTDISETNWAKPAIEEMASKGYIGGYQDGSFMPSKELTRAEIITIINKMNNFTQEADISFTDVKEDNWAYKEIRKAVAAGYVAGFNDRTFKPNDTLTREQMAVMLNNLYKLEEKQTDIVIKDIDSISEWARPAVKNVISHGIMNGYSDGTFSSKSKITRAEGVASLHNITKSEIFSNKNQIKPVEQVPVPAQPTTTTPTNTSSTGGSSGGGGGGGTSTPSQPVQVNEKLQKALDTLNNRVMPKYNTDAQKETAAIISESIEKYINDPTYDITGDVQKAKDAASQMTPEEKKEFQLITTGNMDIGLLKELNDNFKLINY